MKQEHRITVENLKCGGCTATITRRLGVIKDVTYVQVNPDTEEFSFLASADRLELVHETLRSLGYPERGTSSGLSGVGAKAGSLLSCVIGKVGAE